MKNLIFAAMLFTTSLKAQDSLKFNHLERSAHFKIATTVMGTISAVLFVSHEDNRIPAYLFGAAAAICHVGSIVELKKAGRDLRKAGYRGKKLKK